MHVAEKGLLHQMVKIVKKKVIADSKPPSCYVTPHPHKFLASILYCFAKAARLSRQRKDINFGRHLARSFWRTKGEISTILWILPGVVGKIVFNSSIRCTFEVNFHHY